MGAAHVESDFVIVGTGAGGATAARVLAEAGFSLTLVEEGAHLKPEERPRALVDAMALAVRGMATLTTDSLVPMPLLMGRCVGGSTAINSGIVWRTPDDVREAWTREHGLGALVGDALDDALDRIEGELFVHETGQAELGGNSALMARGAEALGLPGRIIHRNVTGCRGSQRCLQGCPNAARQSMDVSYVPRALARGATLVTRATAERVLFEDGRAVAVKVARTDERGRVVAREVLRARRGVIVACGAVLTPLLLARSGIRHARLGEGFQSHPGAAFVGMFDEPVHMGFGASQGYEVPLRAQRLKLEALGLPPDMLAARLPGAGAEWQDRVARLGHYAQWGALVRMEAQGRVRSGLFDGFSVRYEPTARDLEKVRDGLVLVGKMMFAAGAREVYPGISGFPEIVRDVKELDALASGTLKRPQVHLVASHLFGTAAASADPGRGVVDAELAVRGVRGLFAMDASALPTNLGVNPQHTIMGLVWCAAERLAARESERRAAA